MDTLCIEGHVVEKKNNKNNNNPTLKGYKNRVRLCLFSNNSPQVLQTKFSHGGERRKKGVTVELG